MTGPQLVILVGVLLAAACSGDSHQATTANSPPVTKKAPVVDDRPANPSPSPPNPPSSADEHLRALEDPNESVRSRAATALYDMNHPRALEACLVTLDDDADPLHLDRTPSVRCLVGIGEQALPGLFDRLASDDEMTRLHAERAVEGITKRVFGFSGTEWAQGGLDRWLEWWGAIGFAHEGDPEARARAIARLRAWQSSRPGK